MTADPPSDTAKPARLPRRRVAIGPARPQYMHDVETDRMMMIVTALAAEVAALRDRLDTHEALAGQARPISSERRRSSAISTSTTTWTNS